MISSRHGGVLMLPQIANPSVWSNYWGRMMHNSGKTSFPSCGPQNTQNISNGSKELFIVEFLNLYSSSLHLLTIIQNSLIMGSFIISPVTFVFPSYFHLSIFSFLFFLFSRFNQLSHCSSLFSSFPRIFIFAFYPSFFFLIFTFFLVASFIPRCLLLSLVSSSLPSYPMLLFLLIFTTVQ